ncbi:hypothetical protein ACH5RR_015623 [Cinchona calisaya]|uniref:Uncharacterized protein n=1 Tax=Cinchona calisaya TaxID=153742 RepID=A0ABD2ZTP4_9GENT
MLGAASDVEVVTFVKVVHYGSSSWHLNSSARGKPPIIPGICINQLYINDAGWSLDQVQGTSGLNLHDANSFEVCSTSCFHFYVELIKQNITLLGGLDANGISHSLKMMAPQQLSLPMQTYKLNDDGSFLGKPGNSSGRGCVEIIRVLKSDLSRVRRRSLRADRKNNGITWLDIEIDSKYLSNMVNGLTIIP